jgi:C1A family cysteine protease
MYKKSIYFFVLSCFLVTSINAQPPAEKFTTRDANQVRSIGVTDAALFDQLMVTVGGVGSNSRLIQEQQNLKPYMMPVRKLGFRGTAWSYMLAGCLEYYVNIKRNFKDNLSPDYIALSLQSQGTRPSLEQGLQFLVQNGTVSAAIVHYDASQVSSTVYATTKFQINNYLHLFQAFASPREKIFEVRKALMRGNPVLIEFQADQSFSALTQTFEWEATKISTPQNYTLLIIGFDESKQAFEVMSCWGSEWGNNGYIWMPYNDLANATTNGYVMIPNTY